MISFWSELMGRRRKNSFLDDFIEILGAIVSMPYGYIVGGILTLLLLGMSELWMAPSSPEKLGPYAPAIESFIEPFRWFVRFLAVCSFMAALISFIMALVSFYNSHKTYKIDIKSDESAWKLPKYMDGTSIENVAYQNTGKLESKNKALESELKTIQQKLREANIENQRLAVELQGQRAETFENDYTQIGKENVVHQNTGEVAVRNVLVGHCKKSDAHVLNNVTLPDEDGGTTQVDHILISNKGILIVETKHFSGWLFAGERDKYWTQVIFKTKNQFLNPLRQNYKHICVIRKLLDFLPSQSVGGIVVFTGDAVFKTNRPNRVLMLNELQPYIENMNVFHAEISKNRLQFCVGRLEYTRLAITNSTDIEHQTYLEKKYGQS